MFVHVNYTEILYSYRKSSIALYNLILKWNATPWLASLHLPPVRSSSSRTLLPAWCSLCLASPTLLHYSAHSTGSRSPLASSSRLLY
ncbi:UNVERIFIED_CONTAM: hypothetical protein FKN15_043901 [Acipenser sinensis]